MPDAPLPPSRFAVFTGENLSRLSVGSGAFVRPVPLGPKPMAYGTAAAPSAVVRDPAETDRWPLAGRARGGWHLRPAPVQAPPFSAGAALDPELKFISPRKARGQRCGDDSEKPYLLFFTRRRLRDVSV